jgi:hypothetical protein
VSAKAWQRQPPKSTSRRGQLAHGSFIHAVPRKALKAGEFAQISASDRSRTFQNSSPGIDSAAWQGSTLPAGVTLRDRRPQWIRIIEGSNRTKLGYCSTPTALHFNALWKTTPDTQMCQVTAGREIAAKSSWWPATLKVPIPTGVPEQKVFYELIRSERYVERLRRDVMQVVERFAWMQLDDTPGIHSRLREETAQTRAELEQTRRDLAAAAAGAAPCPR